MGRKIQMKKEPIRFTAAGDILITKKIPRENDGIAEISLSLIHISEPTRRS